MAGMVDFTHDLNGDGRAGGSTKGWIAVFVTTVAGVIGVPLVIENPLNQAGGLFGVYLRH